jgi:chemotaxis signal transduction protein
MVAESVSKMEVPDIMAGADTMNQESNAQIKVIRTRVQNKPLALHFDVVSNIVFWSQAHFTADETDSRYIGQYQHKDQAYGVVNLTKINDELEAVLTSPKYLLLIQTHHIAITVDKLNGVFDLSLDQLENNEWLDVAQWLSTQA